MVRARDPQTAKLNEGRQQVARTEEMLGRIEKLAAKTTAQLERATKVKDELGREVARFEQEAQTLTESIGNHVEQLVVKKIEFEAFYRRLRALQTAFYERAPAVESVHKPIEHSLGDHEAGATTTSGGREGCWVSHRRRMSHALTILVTQTPSWAVRHRAHGLGGLGVLALVSFILMRSVGEVDRIGTNEVVPQAQPALNASSPGTPGTMTSSVATSTQTAVTALEQLSREAEFEKPPVRAREFIGTLAVQSDPAGAAVFINRRPVGTTPLRVRRLSAGSHAVWVEREGYERWTAAVLVPADRLTRVNVRLRRAVVSVEVDRPSSDPVIATQETSPGQKQKSHPIVQGVKGLGRGIKRLFGGS
jgi:hypothetical protein